MSTRIDATSQRGMKVARWAAAPTLLMAIPNAFSGPTASSSDMPSGVAWVATVVGLAGLIAGIALLGRVSWGVPAVAGVAVLNLIGSIAAFVFGWSGAPVGLVLSLAALALVAPAVRRS